MVGVVEVDEGEGGEVVEGIGGGWSGEGGGGRRRGGGKN